MIVESNYIRDNFTANSLAKFLLGLNCNKRNIIKFTMSSKFAYLKVGDYIKFNDLMGGVKIFGEDYTTPSARNGQNISRYWFITSISITSDILSLTAEQMPTIITDEALLDFLPSWTDYSNFYPEFSYPPENSEVIVPSNFTNVYNEYDVRIWVPEGMYSTDVKYEMLWDNEWIPLTVNNKQLVINSATSVYWSFTSPAYDYPWLSFVDVDFDGESLAGTNITVRSQLSYLTPDGVIQDTQWSDGHTVGIPELDEDGDNGEPNESGWSVNEFTLSQLNFGAESEVSDGDTNQYESINNRTMNLILNWIENIRTSDFDFLTQSQRQQMLISSLTNIGNYFLRDGYESNKEDSGFNTVVYSLVQAYETEVMGMPELSADSHPYYWFYNENLPFPVVLQQFRLVLDVSYNELPIDSDVVIPIHLEHHRTGWYDEYTDDLDYDIDVYNGDPNGYVENWIIQEARETVLNNDGNNHPFNNMARFFYVNKPPNNGSAPYPSNYKRIDLNKLTNYNDYGEYIFADNNDIGLEDIPNGTLTDSDGALCFGFPLSKMTDNISLLSQYADETNSLFKTYRGKENLGSSTRFTWIYQKNILGQNITNWVSLYGASLFVANTNNGLDTIEEHIGGAMGSIHVAPMPLYHGFHFGNWYSSSDLNSLGRQEAVPSDWYNETGVMAEGAHGNIHRAVFRDTSGLAHVTGGDWSVFTHYKVHETLSFNNNNSTFAGQRTPNYMAFSSYNGDGGGDTNEGINVSDIVFVVNAILNGDDINTEVFQSYVDAWNQANPDKIVNTDVLETYIHTGQSQTSLPIYSPINATHTDTGTGTGLYYYPQMPTDWWDFIQDVYNYHNSATALNVAVIVNMVQSILTHNGFWSGNDSVNSGYAKNEEGEIVVLHDWVAMVKEDGTQIIGVPGTDIYIEGVITDDEG